MNRQEWLADALKRAPELTPARMAEIRAALPPVRKRKASALEARIGLSVTCVLLLINFFSVVVVR